MTDRDNIPVRGGVCKTAHLCLVLAALLGAAACSSVAQMQARYEAGDTSQFARIVTIAARPDYPYATRRAAARALGEIGDPRAVPALVGILGEFDQRTTLKQESLIALGRIGDAGAVTAIGRLLDRSLSDTSQELRLAAMPVLGQLGGEEAATILVNALVYYDLVILQREGRVPRGVFSGDEQSIRDLQDSLRAPGERPTDMMGLGGSFGGGGLFGPHVEMPERIMEDRTEEERRVAHESLVHVGPPAVPVIEAHLQTQRTTPSLARQLRDVVAQIRAVDTVAPGDDAAQTGADSG